MFYIDYVKEKYGTDYIETFRYKKQGVYNLLKIYYILIAEGVLHN